MMAPFPVLAHAAVLSAPPNAVLIPEAPFSWVNVIAQVGFPIAVSVYLLWMTDKRLVRIITILERLTVIMGARGTPEPEEKD